VAGNDVSLLARGEWAEILKENGLRMHHWLQRKDTVDHPMIITEIDGNIHYDAVFTVMQYDQTVTIMEAYMEL
jgi:2-dehydropantoate 2-reductase